MNGLTALRRLLGLHPMNEAPAADAPAATGAPTAEAAPAPAAEAPTAAPAVTSLLGEEPAAPAVEGEAKPDEAAQPEGEKPAEAAKPAEGAPETYEAFTAPEGIELNPAILPKLDEVFRGLGLNQESAQGLLNQLLEIQREAEGTPEQQIEEQDRQIAELNASLAEQTRNLPEIGGANFEASLAVASKVMAQFGTPELRELVKYTAVGSHPEFFKFCHAIGSAMSDDVFENGGASSGGQKSLAERLWPGSN